MLERPARAEADEASERQARLPLADDASDYTTLVLPNSPVGTLLCRHRACQPAVSGRCRISGVIRRSRS